MRAVLRTHARLAPLQETRLHMPACLGALPCLSGLHSLFHSFRVPLAAQCAAARSVSAHRRFDACTTDHAGRQPARPTLSARLRAGYVDRAARFHRFVRLMFVPGSPRHTLGAMMPFVMPIPNYVPPAGAIVIQLLLIRDRRPQRDVTN